MKENEHAREEHEEEQESVHVDSVEFRYSFLVKKKFAAQEK